MTEQPRPPITELGGLINFREVGPLPTVDGRRVRPGVLFRSDTLQYLDAEGLRVLTDEVGLRTVIDLRLPYEVRIEGRGALADVPHNYRQLPFLVSGSEQAGTAVPVLHTDDPIVPHYLGYLRTSPDAVAGVVDALAEGDNVPAVVHCAAGKDRTGVAVAIVLEAVGVRREDIVADYVASAERMPAMFRRLREMRTYGDRLDSYPAEAHTAEARSMQRFLEAVDAEFGGVHAYLRAHGVSDETLAALREQLTEPV